MLGILERYFLKNYIIKAIVILFVFSIIIFSVLIEDISVGLNDVFSILPYVFPMSFKLALGISLSLAWLLCQSSLTKNGEWISLSLFGIKLRRCAGLIWVFGLLALTVANSAINNFQFSNVDLSSSPQTVFTDKGIIYNHHNKKVVIEENKGLLFLTVKDGAGIERSVFRNNDNTPYLSIKLGKYQSEYTNKFIKYNSSFNLLNVVFLWSLMIYFVFLMSRNNFINNFFTQVLCLVVLYICNIQLIKWVSVYGVPGYTIPGFFMFILILFYEKH